MPIHIIPVEKLSAEALQGVIKEFISRHGTDYGEFAQRRIAPGIIRLTLKTSPCSFSASLIKASIENNFKQVKQKLENGLAVLLYDDEMETTNIFRHDDPVLQKL